MSDIDVTEMGDAGKARPVPRGRYSDTETYDYLDFVYSGDASYIAKKLTTGNPPAENNEYWQLFARGGTLTENSDVSNTTVTFEQAENRTNIFSKDSLKAIMGKISKMYSDLKSVAFSGKYTDLEGRVTVTNNDLATIPGTAWDAVRGAQIRRDVDKLNSDFVWKKLINQSINFTDIEEKTFQINTSFKEVYITIGISSSNITQTVTLLTDALTPVGFSFSSNTISAYFEGYSYYSGNTLHIKLSSVKEWIASNISITSIRYR